MVSDHSTFILVFHIVMISEGTEIRHRLNADFSSTKFIATAVTICPIDSVNEGPKEGLLQINLNKCNFICNCYCLLNKMS